MLQGKNLLYLFLRVIILQKSITVYNLHILYCTVYTVQCTVYGWLSIAAEQLWGSVPGIMDYYYCFEVNVRDDCEIGKILKPIL